MNSANDDADVKLCDFGLSITLVDGQQDKQICGTPQYIAPEMILQQGYGKTVDLWAVGCLTYILLAGIPPFMEDTIVPPKPGESSDPYTNLWKAIITGDYSFPDESFKFVSPEAIDLIQGLLQTDPRKRLTVDQALGHKWVRHDGDNLAARHLGDNLRKFKAFRGRMKLRGIVKGIIAVNRFKAALGVKKLSTLKEARASLVPGSGNSDKDGRGEEKVVASTEIELTL
jgi:calcium/calmodulin-dependent protein kinase I